MNHSVPEGSPVLSGDNLVISPVTTSSAGNYTCTAYSERFPENIQYRRFQLFVGGEFAMFSHDVYTCQMTHDVLYFMRLD